MDDAPALLATVTGRDRPGLVTTLLSALAQHGARLLDMEQVVIRDRLVLGIHTTAGDDPEVTTAALIAAGAAIGVEVEVEPLAPRPPRPPRDRHVVTALGQPLEAHAMAGITERIAACGANVDRIVRLSKYPITSFELTTSGGDSETLRTELAAEAAARRIDVAVQPLDLYRRAKRMVVMDVDSTLVQGEVIEELAARAGCGDAVTRITARAMTGELDFERSLRERVALLEGLDAGVLDEVRAGIQLTPGAATLVRTLKRLGYVTAIVSGGFTAVTDALAAELGIDHAQANVLEVADGRLTGRLVGPITDRAGKAEALARFAAAEQIPLSQTVAVGDGANDLDMLTRAGLGIAFNAKPVVRAAADTAVSVPYLDAILFLLGVTREEIEAADEADPDLGPIDAPLVPDGAA